jgi:hypothetical protein
MHLGIFDDNSAHERCQVNHVNGGHKVFTFANNLEGGWVLNPCLLEVVVEDILAVTVSDTCTENMHA